MRVRFAAPTGLALAALLAAGAARGEPSGAAPNPPGARIERLSFADLDGWGDDDQAAAYQAFTRSCRPLPSARPALARICRAALSAPHRNGASARRFFERNFQPFSIVPEAGHPFLTGYFEAAFEGSLAPTRDHPTPLLAPPAVLAPEGAPKPDRAAIEDGALGARARPIVYLDPVDAFMVQVQGSARIRLPDKSVLRVGFAGRNGLPYTSIGRVLAERLAVPPAEMTADRLVAWLKGHPQEARDVMRANRSYIFFRRLKGAKRADGPIGGSGVPLVAGRSLAIDHRIWTYGLPVWLEGRLPEPGGDDAPLHRLTVAQDTGTAIEGPARGDLFFGTGPEAGLRAGLLRAAIRFVVLWPRPAPAALR